MDTKIMEAHPGQLFKYLPRDVWVKVMLRHYEKFLNECRILNKEAKKNGTHRRTDR